MSRTHHTRPPRSSRKKFHCHDCGVDTGKIHEHYMLHDNVWLAATAPVTTHLSPPIRMLCIGCVERRLGRPLNHTDFNGSYLNNPRTAPQSQRLRERLTRAQD